MTNTFIENLSAIYTGIPYGESATSAAWWGTNPTPKPKLEDWETAVWDGAKWVISPERKPGYQMFQLDQFGNWNIRINRRETLPRR